MGVALMLVNFMFLTVWCSSSDKARDHCGSSPDYYAPYGADVVVTVLQMLMT